MRKMNLIKPLAVFRTLAVSVLALAVFAACEQSLSTTTPDFTPVQKAINNPEQFDSTIIYVGEALYTALTNAWTSNRTIVGGGNDLDGSSGTSGRNSFTINFSDAATAGFDYDKFTKDALTIRQVLNDVETDSGLYKQGAALSITVEKDDEVKTPMVYKITINDLSTNGTDYLEVQFHADKITGNKGALKIDRNRDGVAGNANGTDDWYEYVQVTNPPKAEGNTVNVSNTSQLRDPAIWAGIQGSFTHQIPGSNTVDIQLLVGYTSNGIDAISPGPTVADTNDYTAILKTMLTAEEYNGSAWVPVTVGTITKTSNQQVYTATISYKDDTPFRAKLSKLDTWAVKKSMGWDRPLFNALHGTKEAIINNGYYKAAAIVDVSTLPVFTKVTVSDPDGKNVKVIIDNIANLFNEASFKTGVKIAISPNTTFSWAEVTGFLELKDVSFARSPSWTSGANDRLIFTLKEDANQYGYSRGGTYYYILLGPSVKNTGTGTYGQHTWAGYFNPPADYRYYLSYGTLF